MNSDQRLTRKAPLGHLWMAETFRGEEEESKQAKHHPKPVVDMNEAPDPTLLPKGKSQQARFDAVKLPENQVTDLVQIEQTMATTNNTLMGFHQTSYSQMKLDKVDELLMSNNDGRDEAQSDQPHQAEEIPDQHIEDQAKKQIHEEKDVFQDQERPTRKSIMPFTYAMDNEQTLIPGLTYQSWLKSTSEIVSRKRCSIFPSTKISTLMDLPPTVLLCGLFLPGRRKIHHPPLLKQWMRRDEFPMPGPGSDHGLPSLNSGRRRAYSSSTHRGSCLEPVAQEYVVSRSDPKFKLPQVSETGFTPENAEEIQDQHPEDQAKKQSDEVNVAVQKLDKVDELLMSNNDRGDEAQYDQLHQADFADVTINENYKSFHTRTTQYDHLEMFDVEGNEEMQFNYPSQDFGQAPSTMIVSPTCSQEPKKSEEIPDQHPKDQAAKKQCDEEKDAVKHQERPRPTKKARKPATHNIWMDYEKTMIPGHIYQSWLHNTSEIVSRRRKKRKATIFPSMTISALMNLPPTVLLCGLFSLGSRKIHYPAPILKQWMRSIQPDHDSPSGKISPTQPPEPSSSLPPSGVHLHNPSELPYEDTFSGFKSLEKTRKETEDLNDVPVPEFMVTPGTARDELPMPGSGSDHGLPSLNLGRFEIEGDEETQFKSGQVPSSIILSSPRSEEPQIGEKATSIIWKQMGFYEGLHVSTAVDNCQEVEYSRNHTMAVIDQAFCPNLLCIPPERIYSRVYFLKGKEVVDFTLEEPEEVEHGTLCASIAAGSMSEADFQGFRFGPVRGGLPHARVGLFSALDLRLPSVEAAMKAAAADPRNRVISMSLVPVEPTTVALADCYGPCTFEAMQNNVVVCLPVGNGGRDDPVSNSIAWVVTAGSADSLVPIVTDLVLGNNMLTLTRMSINHFPETGPCKLQFHGLITGDDQDSVMRKMSPVSRKGKILVMEEAPEVPDAYEAMEIAYESGAAGMIYIGHNMDHGVYSFKCQNIPCITFGQVDGQKIIGYIKEYGENATGNIMKSEERRNKKGRRTAALMNSRKQTPSTHFLLNPMILADGIDILGAMPTLDIADPLSYTIVSGSSCATAVIAAIIAYLRECHPDWLTSEVISAICTTADPLREFEDIREVLSAGHGIVRPSRVGDPGVVYPCSEEDYAKFILAIAATGDCDPRMVEVARMVTAGDDTVSPHNLNLPYCKAVMHRRVLVFEREIRYVGVGSSEFRAKISSCNENFVHFHVDPDVRTFTYYGDTLRFHVTVELDEWNPEGVLHGLLEWEEVGGAGRIAQSPIVVTRE